MPDIVKFKTGSKSALLGNANVVPAVLPQPIEPGTVYFAIDENDNGSIYFDKNASTRVLMGEHYPRDLNTEYSYSSSLESHKWKTVLTGSDSSIQDATLTFAAGDYVTLTDDAANKKITIAVPTGTTSNTVAVGNHTHATSITTSTGTNQITLAYGGKYALNAGGTSYIFTMPASDNVDTNYYHSSGSWNNFTYTATANNGAPELAFTIPTGTTGSTVAIGNHTHTVSLATDTGTSNITLAHGGKYKLTAGGSSIIFTMPSDNNTTYTVSTGDSNGEIKITPSSGNAYNVAVKGLGSAAYTNSNAYATSNHTHALSIDTDTGTSNITLAHGGKYKLTAGGSTYVFTMPAGYTYTHPSYTAADPAAIKVGRDATGHVTLGDALVPGDIGAATSGHTHTLSLATDTGTSSVTLTHGGKYKLTAGGQSIIFTMPSDINTTYTIATGDNNGQIKVTPSSGNAYNVDVKGLGSAAYTNSSAYATSGHTHTTSIATDTGTNQITLAFGGKYKLTAGGTGYIFTMPTVDAYTKTEIDNKIANVFHYKGNKDAVNNLPTSGNEVGDVWHITADGSERAWDGSAWQELGTVGANHTHSISLATDTGTSSLTLAHGGKYKLTAGGQSLIFTMPSDNNTTYSFSTGDENGQIKVTPSSGSAYNINVKGLGSAAYTNSSAYATSNHTHTLSIATDTGTSSLTLAYGGKYKLTAGGNSYIFTMPSAVVDTNYYHKTGTWSGLTYTAAKVGSPEDLQFTIPTGTTSSTVAPGNHTHSLSIATSTGNSSITLALGGKYQLTAGGSNYVFTMPSHPTYSSVTAAAVKVGRDGTGHVVLGDALTVNDIEDASSITIRRWPRQLL